MSRDYSYYRSSDRPEPSRYRSDYSHRRMPPAPPPPAPTRSTFQPDRDRSSSYRQAQQFWRERDEPARPHVRPAPQRTVSPPRRYRLEPPSPPAHHQHRHQSRPHRSTGHSEHVSPRTSSIPPPRPRHQHQPTPPVPTSNFRPAETRPNPMARHRSVATLDQLLPAPFLFANLLQNFFDLHHPFDSDDDEMMPMGMIVVGRVLPFDGASPFPGAIHIRFHGLLGEPHEEQSVGLDEEEIERIPVLTYRKSSSRSNSNDDKCAVCLSEFNHGDQVKRLKCKHYFHVDCIDPWLKTSTRCPICRGDQNNN